MPAPPRRPNIFHTGHVATIVVVVVAFVVAYVTYFSERGTGSAPPFTTATLVVATVLGAIYLALLVSVSPADPPLTRRRKTLLFAVLTALMLAIEFLLAGAYTIWLISMPLVAAASTDLPRGPRWVVYGLALLGVALPIYLRYGNWQSSFYFVLTYFTAFVFVIAFVRLTDAAERAQRQAEALAGELAEANNRLAAFAVQAEELATTQERNRLAREIHDNLGHYLTVVHVQINAARALLGQDPARADDALDKAARLSQEGLAAVRQSVSALRDSPLGRRTLPEAVAALADETQAAGIIAELRVAGAPRPLEPRAELTLYRAAQEGLTNVRKHARASRVDLTLDYDDPATVSLTIRDNGLGLGAAEAPGFGLLGLEERARQLGGRLGTDAAPGGGYSLTITLPTPAAAPEGAAA